MEPYISKAALVAEIERLITELVEEGEDTMFEQGRISAFEDIKVFVNHTLEVKEVDLEKEANEAWDYIFSHGWDENSRMALKHDEYMVFAQHFFELGLKTQKGE